MAVISLHDIRRTFGLAKEEKKKGIFSRWRKRNGDSGNGADDLSAEGVEVLKGVSLDIDQGEFVALQGSSGSGKSTLLHIIGLLDRPTAGSYMLKGGDVARMEDDELSALRNRYLGFIFQSFYLIPYATAVENVLLPGRYAEASQVELKERAEYLLEQVGLGDRMNFRPASLSGGQQQRVAMARALLNQPEIILADEPTGQLDSTTSRDIMELFTKINDQGTTIIIVTHDEETAAASHRRIYLHDGMIVDHLG